MAQLTVDPSKMTKSTKTLTDALVFCREHSLNSEQQQEVIAHSKGTFLDVIPCNVERRDSLKARLFSNLSPEDLKELVQRCLKVLLEDSQWYEKTLEKGLRIDLRAYQSKEPKGGGKGTGKEGKVGFVPKVDPSVAPNPAPAVEPTNRCRLCGNNPDRQDQNHKCNLDTRTCSNRGHPDLQGHTFDTTFAQTANGKAYKRLRPKVFGCITWNKKLSNDKKSLVDRVSAHLSKAWSQKSVKSIESSAID